MNRRGFFSALGSGVVGVALPPGPEVVMFDPYAHTYSTGSGWSVTEKDLVEAAAHLRVIDRRYDEIDVDFRVRLYQSIKMPQRPLIIISAP